MFDTLIQGGTLVDGIGSDAVLADVGIVGDRITAIGNLQDGSAKETLSADGFVVAPGFVDVHNHSDGLFLRETHLAAKTAQGFTTEVLAADGISYAPVNEQTARQWMFYLRALNGLRLEEYRGWESLAEYMECIDGSNVQNAMTHIPYANLRSMACGWGRGAVDDFQMRQIQYEVQRGMESGAVGLSTGLDYIVQCFSTTDELVEVCRSMASYGGLYVTHIRYKKGLMEGLQEAVEIGRRAGVGVHISHLKPVAGCDADEVLGFLDRNRGDVDLSFDVYPYMPGSTMLSYLLPNDVWEDGPLAVLGHLHDPGVRRRFEDGLKAQRLNLDRIYIAWVASKENAVHQGKTLASYVAGTQKSASDALADLLIEERLGVLCVMQEGDDELIRPFLQHDLYMMGSDGIYFEDGAVHPRVYGSVGRLLGSGVRDWSWLTLEDAIYKLSGWPARRFGMAHRGVAQIGNYADLVVFDPKSISAPATYQEPHQRTTGMQYVIVNGVVIVREEVPEEPHAEPAPGRFLRYAKTPS